MNITLNQKDIQKALLLYIIGQGINMEGKTLDVTFTSGRKDNGLTAALHISETVIPGFTDTPDVASATPPVAPVVQLAVETAASIPSDQQEAVAVSTTPVEAATTLTDHDAALVASLGPISTSASLFAPAEPAVAATSEPEPAVAVVSEPEKVTSLFSGQ